MDNVPIARALGLFIFFGAIISALGAMECVKGHNYSVAAQHELTAVGRIVRVPRGRGTDFEYVFSVNGVKADDSSEVCATPLESGACYNYGPVLAYYTNQPYPNSRLQDFAVASANAYQIGRPALEIGLPLFILPSVAVFLLLRSNKRNGNPDDRKEEVKATMHST